MAAHVVVVDFRLPAVRETAAHIVRWAARLSHHPIVATGRGGVQTDEAHAIHRRHQRRRLRQQRRSACAAAVHVRTVVGRSSAAVVVVLVVMVVVVVVVVTGDARTVGGFFWGGKKKTTCSTMSETGCEMDAQVCAMSELYHI